MSSKKRKQFPPFRGLDGYLSDRTHWWIAVGIVSGVYWLALSRGQDIVNPIILAVMTVWMYSSSRKYGFLDTVLFLAALPFMFLSAVISLTGSRRSEPHALTPQELRDFTLAAIEGVHRSINKIYTGKIIDSRIEESGVYVLVETPYGLRIPEREAIAGIGEEMHISPLTIRSDTVSENRNYYIFGPEAARRYTEEKNRLVPFMTFSGIKDRFLCKSSLRISRQSLLG